ncbi:hypothetical protein AKJ16_DCAP20310 [Drosera capensis]
MNKCTHTYLTCHQDDQSLWMKEIEEQGSKSHQMPADKMKSGGGNNVRVHHLEASALRDIHFLIGSR